MKKQLKRTFAIITLSTLCLCVSGCGKMTAEKLLAKVEKALDGKSVGYTEFELDLGATYKMNLMGEELNMDLLMDMDMEVWAAENPMVSYMEGTLNAEVMDQPMETTMKIYSEEHDGIVSTYTYTDLTEEWEYEETEQESTATSTEAITSQPLSEIFTDLVLEEETTELEGKEAYVLHLNCSGDKLDSVMGQAGNNMLSSAGYGELSLKGLNVPVVYYIDKKTFLPIRMEFAFEGMDNLVNQMMAEELGALDEKSLRGSEEENDMAAELLKEMGITIENCSLSMIMNNPSYDPQEVPTVPEDVKESVANSEDEEEELFDEEFEDSTDESLDESWEDYEESDAVILDDGRYLLENEDFSLKVSIPEGCAEDYCDDTYLSFAAEDYSVLVTYELIHIDEVDSYKDIMTDTDYSVESKTISTPFGEGEAYIIQEDTMHYSYLFVEKGNSALMLNILTGESSLGEGEEAIQNILGTISE